LILRLRCSRHDTADPTESDSTEGARDAGAGIDESTILIAIGTMGICACLLAMALARLG